MAGLADLLHIESTIARLVPALLLGALIGAERQLRLHAGLRTNALVCLGAAAFVDLATRVGSTAGTTQVIAYVVSGVGFLGAGAIMKEGVNIRGMNTAATLWCSAAVGAAASAGVATAAVVLCILVVATNLFLRPLMALLDRRREANTEGDNTYAVRILCAAQDEAHLRALLLNGFGQAGIALRSLVSADTERAGQVEVKARCAAPRGKEPAIEQVTGRLSLEASVSAVQWDIVSNEG